MLHFKRSVVIKAAVETVWTFHERLDVLQVLTPPWQPVEVVRREGGLGQGAESEFRLWLGPLPVRWLARHTGCQPLRWFEDIQQQGPMVHWRHHHGFEPISDHQMQLTDEIEYALPSGSLTEPLLEYWITSRLSDMFAYRHRVTQIACEPLLPHDNVA